MGNRDETAGWHMQAAQQQLADAERRGLSSHTRLTCAHNAVIHAGIVLLLRRALVPPSESWEQCSYDAVVTACGDDACAWLRTWYANRYDPDAAFAISSDDVDTAVKAARSVARTVFDRD